jgi:hypothetical protein
MGVTSHFTSELWQKEEVFARSIAAKLRQVGFLEAATTLDQCHTRETFCHCLDCGQVQALFNRCDRFYCPMCVQKLAYRRKLSVQAWAEAITQPKHVVLTARNTTHLTKTYVKWFKANLSKLRRLKSNTHWRGGLISLEVTNEGRGWHLHSHLLVDCDWIQAADLAQQWARLVSQDFAIVKVKSTQDRAYLQEVTKYAVKGSEEAHWRPGDIWEFIEAMTGVRQFSVFGTLFKDRALRSKILEELTPEPNACKKCASTHLTYLDDNEEDWLETTGQWPNKRY